MADQNQKLSPEEKQVKAYNRMLERVKTFIDEADKEYTPKIQYGIEEAKEKATELGELSREEAEKIGSYLRRDLLDAAQFLATTDGEFAKWLKFDIELIEDRFAELFPLVADQTWLELDLLAERARRNGVWHTGEVTGIGSLQCEKCGEALHFHKTGHIPPCPKCNGTSFHRLTD